MTDIPEITPNPDDFLTPDERTTLHRLLSSPEEFPREFGSWLTQYLAVNGEFFKRQVAGIADISVNLANSVVGAENLALVSGSSANWVDLPTLGPILTGLSNGLYLVTGGCHALLGPDVLFVTLSVNDVIQAVSVGGGFFGNVITTGGLSMSGGIVGSAWFSGARTWAVSCEKNNNNTIKMQYRYLKLSASAVQVQDRWMSAIKYGNVQGG